jgi:ParB family transcriptional regulator, chromosome partitioning protein
LNDTQELTSVAAQLIRPGDNDRTEFAPQELQELATNITVNGLAQPITIRPVEPDLAGTCYEIVCGERRFRACTQLLGWDTVPVIIRPLSDLQASAIMLAENMARVDLDPISEGRSYHKRIVEHSLTPAEVAEMAGVPVSRVKARIRTLEGLSDNAQQDYIYGLLNHQQALELCTIDKDRQAALLWAMRRDNFSTDEWRTLLERIRVAQAEDNQRGLFDSDDWQLIVEEWAPKVKAIPPFTRRAALNLIEKLGERVPDLELQQQAFDFTALYKKGLG